jgi:hypothetical protein
MNFLSSINSSSFIDTSTMNFLNGSIASFLNDSTSPSSDSTSSSPLDPVTMSYFNDSTLSLMTDSNSTFLNDTISDSTPPFNVYTDWRMPPSVLNRRAATNAVLCAGGLITNLLALYATVRLNRKQWKPDGVLLANLWVSNILVCYLIADKMVRYLTRPFFGIVYCKIRAYLLYVSVGSSVLSLALLSVHRCFKVAFPFNTKLGFTTVKRSLVGVAIQWAINLLIVMLPLTGTMGNLGFEKRIQNCRSIVGADRSMHSLFVIVYTVGTSLIHVVSYTKIFIKVREQNRTMARNAGSTTSRAQVSLIVVRPSSKPATSRNPTFKVPNNKVTPLPDSDSNVTLIHEEGTASDSGNSATASPGCSSKMTTLQGSATTTTTQQTSSNKPTTLPASDQKVTTLLGCNNSSNTLTPLSDPRVISQGPGSSSSSSNGTGPSSPTTLTAPTASCPRRKREIRLALMSFGFVLTYLLCFVPFGVTSALRLFTHPLHQLAADLVWAFVVINPVLYVYGDQRIKKILKEMVKC